MRQIVGSFDSPSPLGRKEFSQESKDPHQIGGRVSRIVFRRLIMRRLRFTTYRPACAQAVEAAKTKADLALMVLMFFLIV